MPDLDVTIDASVLIGLGLRVLLILVAALISRFVVRRMINATGRSAHPQRPPRIDRAARAPVGHRIALTLPGSPLLQCSSATNAEPTTTRASTAFGQPRSCKLVKLP